MTPATDPTIEPARFVAYLNSVLGYQRVAASDDEARAWALADEAARAANESHAHHSWAEVWDREANCGRGDFSFLLDAL